MPITSWRDIAGKKCEQCGKPATHYYGNQILCCQCHGGNLVTPDETKAAHEKYMKESGKHEEWDHQF